MTMLTTTEAGPVPAAAPAEPPASLFRKAVSVVEAVSLATAALQAKFSFFPALAELADALVPERAAETADLIRRAVTVNDAVLAASFMVLAWLALRLERTRAWSRRDRSILSVANLVLSGSAMAICVWLAGASPLMDAFGAALQVP